MRIDGLPPVLQQTLLAALPKAAESFRARAAVAEPQAAPAPAPLVPAAATSVQMLVAMAATEPTIERRRRMAEKADQGLTMLERLHAELVAGVTAPERLEELAEWAESFAPPEDPQLAQLAREIEVRVRVEIAKFEMRA